MRTAWGIGCLEFADSLIMLPKVQNRKRQAGRVGPRDGDERTTLTAGSSKAYESFGAQQIAERLKRKGQRSKSVNALRSMLTVPCDIRGECGRGREGW